MNTVGFTWTQSGGLQSFGPSGTLAFAISDLGTVVDARPRRAERSMPFRGRNLAESKIWALSVARKVVRLVSTRTVGS